MLFVAVHVGCGFHAKAKEGQLNKVCADACAAAMARLREGADALEAAVQGCRSLESSPLTNTGYGSNLTADGEVECDASAMLSADPNPKTGGAYPATGGAHPLYGAVGAVSGLRYPSAAAEAVARGSAKEQDDLTLISPNCIVATGAQRFARAAGVEIAEPDALISPEAKRRWTEHSGRKAEYDARIERKSRKRASTDSPVSPATTSPTAPRVGPAAKASRGTASRTNNNNNTTTTTTTSRIGNGHSNGASDSAINGHGTRSTRNTRRSCRITSSTSSPSPAAAAAAASDAADAVSTKPRSANARAVSANAWAVSSSSDAVLEALYDTVGIICLDRSGRSAAVSSSGGISLKHCGRVGQAATFGAGCFADAAPTPPPPGGGPTGRVSVAAATTGTGEELVKTQLASEISRVLTATDDADVITAAGKGLVIDTPRLGPRARREAGFVGFRATKDRFGHRLIFAHGHSTASMGIGHMCDADTAPHCKIVRPGLEVGNAMFTEVIKIFPR